MRDDDERSLWELLEGAIAPDQFLQNENENENEDEKEQEKSENTRQTSLNPTMQRKNERRLLDLRRQMAVAPTIVQS